MKKTYLIATLLAAVALSACGKKEEAAARLPLHLPLKPLPLHRLLTQPRHLPLRQHPTPLPPLPLLLPRRPKLPRLTTPPQRSNQQSDLKPASWAGFFWP